MSVFLVLVFHSTNSQMKVQAITILLLTLFIPTAIEYDIRCPAHAEWRLKASVSCFSEDKYVCLLNLLNNSYKFSCEGSDQSRIGSKLVYQPWFNLAECNAKRFQPIIFNTNGNSECILLKSKCDEDGQIIYGNGSQTNDTTCRCDYRRGYSFVSKPRNSCYCIPSEEDCSCFRVNCKKLSPDYQCIIDGQIIANTTCGEIYTPLTPYNKQKSTIQHQKSNAGLPYAHQVSCFIIGVTTVFIIIAVLLVYYLVPPKIIAQETITSDYSEEIIGLKCYVESYLPLTSVIWYNENGAHMYTDTQSCNTSSRNRITTHFFKTSLEYDTSTYICIASNMIGSRESQPVQLNSKSLEDVKRQNIIHELLLKGECGKHYFARVVFIGKNGVGKTSLMRRLLWQNKEDVTSTKSTDGIEIEKCNINVTNGKWSPCAKIDDDLTRLINQVYTEKKLNVEIVSGQSVLGDSSNNIEKSSTVIDRVVIKEECIADKKQVEVVSPTGHKEISYLQSDADTISDETYETYKFHTYPDGVHELEINIKRSKSSLPVSKKQDNPESEDDISNQIKPKNLIQENADDIESENQSSSDDDENIDQMTSAIVESYLQQKDGGQHEIFAFCWLWDFAGQKDFYATHQVFLSKCAVFLLVTDSLEFSTAEKLWADFEDSAQYVRFWFDAIHCYWSTTENNRLDPAILVVCTNEDKYKDPLERQKRQDNFKENLGKILCGQKKKEHLRNVYFLSNTEDDDNVFEEIRSNISNQAMDMKDWGRNCPLKWLLFQKVFQKLKESHVPISTTAKLMKIAKHDDIGITNDDEFILCLQYCHDIGTVIFFDEENLKNHVILDPKWLIDAFRCLVSDKIENVIKVSDDWQKLKETGELTDSLISNLFRKEPKLMFLENKTHIIEVMKRFDIIVNLKDSAILYMPCMMEASSFIEIQQQFMDENQFKRSSWLCLEFKFLPPAFFNHILAWYIKQYPVSVILDKTTRNKRHALYRQIGVFNLDSSGCEQLVVCEAPNIIALQVWDSSMSDHTYGDLGTQLFSFIETLRNRYSLKLSFSKTFTCEYGDFAVNRLKLTDLLDVQYRCLEHKKDHLTDNLIKPWNFEKDLLKIKSMLP